MAYSNKIEGRSATSPSKDKKYVPRYDKKYDLGPNDEHVGRQDKSIPIPADSYFRGKIDKIVKNSERIVSGRYANTGSADRRSRISGEKLKQKQKEAVNVVAHKRRTKKGVVQVKASVSHREKVHKYTGGLTGKQKAELDARLREYKKIQGTDAPVEYVRKLAQKMKDNGK